MLRVNATAIRWQTEPAVAPDRAVCIQAHKVAAIGPTADLARYPRARGGRVAVVAPQACAASGPCVARCCPRATRLLRDVP